MKHLHLYCAVCVIRKIKVVPYSVSLVVSLQVTSAPVDSHYLLSAVNFTVPVILLLNVHNTCLIISLASARKFVLFINYTFVDKPFNN